LFLCLSFFVFFFDHRLWITRWGDLSPPLSPSRHPLIPAVLRIRSLPFTARSMQTSGFYGPATLLNLTNFGVAFFFPSPLFFERPRKAPFGCLLYQRARGDVPLVSSTWTPLGPSDAPMKAAVWMFFFFPSSLIGFLCFSFPFEVSSPWPFPVW